MVYPVGWKIAHEDRKKFRERQALSQNRRKEPFHVKNSYLKWAIPDKTGLGGNMRTSSMPPDHGDPRIRTLLAKADYHTAEGKELLERHFPEKRWRRVSGVTGPLIFIGILGLSCLSIAFFLPNIVIKSLMGVFSIWTIVVTLPTVWSHRNDEIVLTADGIKGPRWKRPLRFADVEKIGLRRIFLAKTGKTFFEMNHF